MSLAEAAIAAARFGLGPQYGDIDAIASDPRGWLAAQIEHPPRPPARIAALQSTGNFLRSLPAGPRPIAQLPNALEIKERVDVIFRVEVAQRLAHQIETPASFHERLVRFWSNHFTVSVTNQAVLGVAGAFEREAIRPHVTGKFKDMLLAATRHPAMLVYLDNARSIGPGSPAGRVTDRGLNENHARELLELHTLGVDGGYTQGDVIALAEILTGWSVSRGPDTRGNGFEYFSNRHEPGEKTLLHRNYRSRRQGEQEGIDALQDLAAHPSTAKFIARKLVRHFVADDPPSKALIG